MIKNDCPHFPCHKELEDCTYCYCPIYPCEQEEFRKWINGKNNKKIWDCSDCLAPHEKGMVKSMEQILKKQGVVHPCVRCGYCCKQRPCDYGERIEEHCRFLQVDDPELGTYKCLAYNEIKEVGDNSRWPLFDCGCSSPLFNTVRDEVIRKTRERNGH